MPGRPRSRTAFAPRRQAAGPGAVPAANEARRAALDALLLPLPGVVAGKMFGCPAYCVGRKLFACVIGDGVGVKVPEGLAQALLAQEHIAPFQPMGRPRMREWVQANRRRAADYRLDMDIFRAALDHVSALTGK